jgi:hypothetical protein
VINITLKALFFSPLEHSNEYKSLIIFLSSGDIINMTPTGYLNQEEEKQLNKIATLICGSIQLNVNQVIAR